MQSLVVSIIAAALVSTGPAPTPPRTLRPPLQPMQTDAALIDPAVHRQLDRIDETIRDARRSGKLSRKEAKTLRREGAQLRRMALTGPWDRSWLVNQAVILRDAVNIRIRASEPRVAGVNSPGAGR